MKNYVRNNLPKTYSVLKKVYRIIYSLLLVRINAHDFFEQIASVCGQQIMSRHDIRAYKQFYEHVARQHKNKLLVIDVGAHDGWFIRATHRFLKQDVQILAFEPQRQKIKTILGSSSSVALFSKAVGAKPGRATMTELGSTGLSSLRQLASSYQYQADFDTRTKATHEVEVTTLDIEVLNQENLDIILKVDTQGFEYEVLQGAQTLLLSGKIKYIIIELMTVEKYAGATTYLPVFTLLENYGYSLYDINCTYYEPLSGKMTEFDAFFELRKK